ERAAVLFRMREFNLQMPVYHVENLASEPRKVFDFAKALGAKIIVTRSAGDLAEVEKLADEFGVNVAVEGNASAAIEARGKRIGLAAELGSKSDLQPSPRIMMVTTHDGGGPHAPDFFLAAFRAELKPLYIVIDSRADLGAAINAWEKSMQPAMTARVK